jgi:hypothetical protein
MVFPRSPLIITNPHTDLAFLESAMDYRLLSSLRGKPERSRPVEAVRCSDCNISFVIEENEPCPTARPVGELREEAPPDLIALADPVDRG